MHLGMGSRKLVAVVGAVVGAGVVVGGGSGGGVAAGPPLGTTTNWVKGGTYLRPEIIITTAWWPCLLLFRRGWLHLSSDEDDG